MVYLWDLYGVYELWDLYGLNKLYGSYGIYMDSTNYMVHIGFIWTQQMVHMGFIWTQQMVQMGFIRTQQMVHMGFIWTQQMGFLWDLYGLNKWDFYGICMELIWIIWDLYIYIYGIYMDWCYLQMNGLCEILYGFYSFGGSIHPYIISWITIVSMMKNLYMGLVTWIFSVFCKYALVSISMEVFQLVDFAEQMK